MVFLHDKYTRYHLGYAIKISVGGFTGVFASYLVTFLSYLRWSSGNGKVRQKVNFCLFCVLCSVSQLQVNRAELRLI